MASDVLVSFVVPAHNEEALIARCLASIKAEVSRTECTSEIIVVDNNSTDSTRSIALSTPGVAVVHEPVKGLVQARSAGYLATNGKLIANIDADTVLTEGWLRTALAEFERIPKLVALSGPYVYYDLSKTSRLIVAVFYRVAFVFYVLVRFVIRAGSMMQGGNFIVSRKGLNEAGGYNSTFSFYGEDTDLARRLSKVGVVKFSFRLRALSSGRRFAKEGLVKVGWRYSVNFLWATFMKRPFTSAWTDLREDSLKESETKATVASN